VVHPIATPSRSVRFLLVLLPAMMTTLVVLWAISSGRDRREREEAVAIARNAEDATARLRTEAEQAVAEAQQRRLSEKKARDDAHQYKRNVDELAFTLASVRASNPAAAAHAELLKQAQTLTAERDQAREEAARQHALAEQETQRAAEAEKGAQRAREEALRLAKEKDASKPRPDDGARAAAEQALRKLEAERQKLADEVAALRAENRRLAANKPPVEPPPANKPPGDLRAANKPPVEPLRPREAGPMVPPPPVVPVVRGAAWQAHPAAVRGLAASPDGRRLATTGGGVTRLWDATSGELVHEWKGQDGVFQVAYSSDGKQLATLDRDGQARILDADSGHETRSLRCHAEGEGSLCFRPGTTCLLTGGADCSLRLFDVGTGGEILTLREDGSIRAVAFSADGHWLAVGKNSGQVALGPLAGQGEPRFFQAHSGGVLALTFSPDGRQVATGGGDGVVHLWETQSGRRLLSLRGHEGPVTSLAFSRDGSRVAAGGGSQARVWDAGNGQDLFKVEAQADSVAGVAFDAAGRRLFVGQGNAVRVCDLEPAPK
jgi:hypothetical protein